jgi:hypothetical protein
LILQDKNDNTNYIKFDVTGSPVDKSTYWEFPVSVTASGGSLPNAAILASVTAAAAGGGGNVSNVGTPTNGQWAQWTDATHIQGIATASMPFVQKAGDTMTGALTLPGNPTSALQAAPKQYADLMLPLAGGTLTGIFYQVMANPQIELQKTASGQANYITGRTNISPRWQLVLGDTAAESGASAGSNFSLTHFSDGASPISIPIYIRRSDGIMALGRSASAQIHDASANINVRHNDTGGLNRAISIVNVNNTLANAIIFYNGSATIVGQINTDSSSTAFVTSSDVRLKTDLTPFTRGREILDQITVHDFTWKGTDEHDTGVIAQDVERVFPKAVARGHGEPGDADFVPYQIDNPKLVPILIQALQEAFREIDALKAQSAREID